eukprot:TRINITY_DN8282_c0_g1_i7.p1 TRINITY_DN8282_c0_g1~~TRINITY_DN8282_c0_g1_i7.p1  ORF type:complete len:132 (-),score=0.60 TRINITY_DN8282_c0_g1_i7:91-486(-)
MAYCSVKTPLALKRIPYDKLLNSSHNTPTPIITISAQWNQRPHRYNSRKPILKQREEKRKIVNIANEDWFPDSMKNSRENLVNSCIWAIKRRKGRLRCAAGAKVQKHTKDTQNALSTNHITATLPHIRYNI